MKKSNLAVMRPDCSFSFDRLAWQLLSVADARDNHVCTMGANKATSTKASGGLMIWQL
jgi:hypothetical protein